MATERLAILGQLAPAAGILTDLYTVPAAKSAVISSIMVCNRSAAATTFTITAAPGGVADAVSQHLFELNTVPGSSTTVIQCGITLAATDVLRVLATLATVSFTSFGSEVSP